MIKKNIVCFATFFFLIFKVNYAYSEFNNSIIISVGKYPITQIDLFKEIKLIAVLSGSEINDTNRLQIRDLAVNSLIKKTIKTAEVEKRQISKYSKKDLENLISQSANNLGVDKDGLKDILESNSLSYKKLIEKFQIDLKWNSMIFEIYKNKISINTVEVENRLKLELKKLEIDENNEEKIEEIKKNIVNQEKNKKLRMFSNSHYSNLERLIQVKFL